jgi:alkylresorcinol/alkylpyrone synthase
VQRVSITRAASAHPAFELSQDETAAKIAVVVGERRRAAAIAHGTHIERRAFCIPPAQIASLGSIESRNAVYRRSAPTLGLKAAAAAVSERAGSISFLVTSSCTGFMLPGLDVEIARGLRLSRDTVRLPITQAGCAGGVVALARAADYLRSRPAASALAVSVELCSLAFQASADEASMTSNLIFADGAGAALLESGAPEGALEIVDSLSLLSPQPAEVLGFELTDGGFRSLLSRQLVDVLPPPTGEAVRRLLGRNGVEIADVGFWLLHPGGARLLSKLEKALGIARCRDHWSWESMAAHGNTSSAAVFDVVKRYLEDDGTPGGWGIVAAFGPGISIELILVRRC